MKASLGTPVPSCAAAIVRGVNLILNHTEKKCFGGGSGAGCGSQGLELWSGFGFRWLSPEHHSVFLFHLAPWQFLICFCIFI